MKQDQIKVGKEYSNGNSTSRKVLEMGVQIRLYDGKGTISNDGVRYIQTAGPYKGKEFTLQLKSFAQWAKAEVTA